MNKYLLLMLLILSSGNTFASASKWIDEQGKVHYSDQPPPAQAKSKSILNTHTPTEAPSAVSGVSGVPATSGVPDTNKPATETDAAQKAAAKKAAAAKAAQDAAIKEQNRANCLSSQQNLAVLKDGMRIAVVDPVTGERSYLDDEQRAKNMDDAQKLVDKYCQ